MGNKQKIYDQLKKQYSDEEIADAHIIGEELTNEEQAAANEEMRQVRLEKLKNKPSRFGKTPAAGAKKQKK